MPTQMNFGPKQPYKTASTSATVKHAQSNFQGGGTTKQGGTNRSKVPVQFSGKQGVASPKSHGPHFGSKGGTGQKGGY